MYRKLLLDPATTTGWCIDIDDEIKDSGIFKTKEKNESRSNRFLRFKTFILDKISVWDIDFVGYEKPSQGHFSGTRTHANFEGVLLAELAQIRKERLMSYMEVSPNAIKKVAKDTVNLPFKGNYDKPMMVKSAKEFFDFDIIDDNHADALWLAMYIRKILS